MRALLRRTGQADTGPPDELRFDGLCIDARRHEVAVDGQVAPGTPREFQLLLVLAREPGRAFSRLELLDRAFGYSYEGLERTVDAHIRNLRRKIEADVDLPALRRDGLRRGLPLRGRASCFIASASGCCW